MDHIKTLRNSASLLRYATTAFLVLLTGSSCLGDEASKPVRKPTTGYVAVEKTLLHSGPSSEYYATSLIKRGTPIEVYHRTDDGWLAIRPPEGSFSWVPAAQAYLLPGGKTIEITDSRAVSWIGSEIGSAKQYRWQVQLQQGEQLRVVGEGKIKTDGDQQEVLWYKIGPPAGEFRWIEEKAVSKTPVSPTTTPTASTSPTPTSPTEESVSAVASKADSATSTPPDVNKVELAAANTSANSGDLVTTAEFATSERTKPRASSNKATKNVKKVKPKVQTASGEMPIGEMPIGEMPIGEMPNEMPIVSEESFENFDEGSKWADWHLMEIDDYGMRYPYLERLSGKGQAYTDPLAHDPFSLAMPKRNTGEAGYGQGNRVRRSGGWRDPRTLRNGRDGMYSPELSYSPNQGYNSPGQDALLQDSPSALANGALGGLLDRGRNALRGNDGRGNDARLNDARGNDGRMPTTPGVADFGRPILDPNANPASVTSQQPWQARQSPTMANNIPGAPNANDANWYGLGGGGGAAGVGNAPNLNPSMNAPRAGASVASVADLQVELSQVVARPVQEWNLSSLAERTRYLVENGADALERGQARLLLDRIQEFQDVARRSIQTASNLPVQQASFQQPIPSGTYSNFDATGWLVATHTSNPEMPTHALTTDNGDIVAYVSAVPGLNLDRYVDAAVGINGLRGYTPQLKAGHIQASNVVRLR